MLTHVSQPKRSPLPLLLAGAFTILGYYGVPWWAGWPATMTLVLAERTFAISEQGVVSQAGAFFVAAIVNVVAWMLLLHALAAAIRRVRRVVQ